MMLDPVIAADGHTYQRLAAAEWLTAYITSHWCHPHAKLVPTVIIKSAIAHQKQLLQMR